MIFLVYYKFWHSKKRRSAKTGLKYYYYAPILAHFLRWYMIEISHFSFDVIHSFNRTEHSEQLKFTVNFSFCKTHQLNWPESVWSEPAESGEYHPRYGRQAVRTNQQTPVVTSKRYLLIENHHEKRFKGTQNVLVIVLLRNLRFLWILKRSQSVESEALNRVFISKLDISSTHYMEMWLLPTGYEVTKRCCTRSGFRGSAKRATLPPLSLLKLVMKRWPP